MFVFRVDFQTGQRLEMAFRARDQALAARDKIDAGKPGALVVIEDDHGHSASIRLTGILAVLVTDVAAERIGMMEAAVVAQDADEAGRAQFAPMLRAPEPMLDRRNAMEDWPRDVQQPAAARSRFSA